jgi:hypothetical protein
MTTSTPTPDYGRRLIPILLDDFAISEPSRPHVSVPIDEEDISKGFKDITVKQLANAVNKASWWLDEQLGNSTQRAFEVFAYFGPRHMRYLCLQVAAMKTGRNVSYRKVQDPINVLKGYRRFS